MNQSILDLVRLAGLPDGAAQAAILRGSDPVFPIPYRVAQAGAAAIAACGIAAADLWRIKTGRSQTLTVDARAAAAALRSNRYLRIDGSVPVRPTSPVTGYYPVKEGRWIYLHCDFSNLRHRNLGVLGAAPDPASVAAQAARWDGLELEKAIFAAGGCGSLVRSEAQWNALPQAIAVQATSLLEIVQIGESPVEPLPAGDRPLSGIRVLDLTRVLAGPTGARTLAEHGADVLKISREGLPDSGLFDYDTGLGKLSAYLDLRETGQMETLKSLIRTGDIFSQSYRPGALAARGLSPQALAAIRPGIVYLTLSAWGHTGPWSGRRGYDTVVQGANGMAYRPGNARPEFMPVSAQDYIAGYLMAYGAMVALGRRARQGGSWMVRVSLARVGQWIRAHGMQPAGSFESCSKELAAEELRSLLMDTMSPMGRLTHLAPVVQMSETPARWERPSVPLGSSMPAWPE
jgi:crotonobetainyl-CoA:carnitine CoA-transferase CaiB-like acyl-CoA transferase